jgi:hypothetical protein
MQRTSMSSAINNSRINASLPMFSDQLILFFLKICIFNVQVHPRVFFPSKCVSYEIIQYLYLNHIACFL